VHTTCPCYLLEGREDARLRARLIDFRELSPDVRHFVFEVPGVPRLEFLAGQWVSLSEVLHGHRITRAYSIASPPDGNRFELCLNRVVDGHFSPYLFRLQPGDAVAMQGPLGTFTLRDPGADAVFVATGTGIAPIRSILLDQLRRPARQQFTLLFGVRHEHGILYRDEFEELERRCPGFHFIPTLSRPGGGWPGRTGHVQQHLRDVLGDRRDLHIYVCGLKAMVNSVRSLLKEWGFDRKHIIYERYD